MNDIRLKLAAFASRIGLTGLALTLALAGLAVQTVRLEGAAFWPLRRALDALQRGFG